MLSICYNIENYVVDMLQYLKLDSRDLIILKMMLSICYNIENKVVEIL